MKTETSEDKTGFPFGIVGVGGLFVCCLVLGIGLIYGIDIGSWLAKAACTIIAGFASNVPQKVGIGLITGLWAFGVLFVAVYEGFCNQRSISSELNEGPGWFFVVVGFAIAGLIAYALFCDPHLPSGDYDKFSIDQKKIHDDFVSSVLAFGLILIVFGSVLLVGGNELAYKYYEKKRKARG